MLGKRPATQARMVNAVERTTRVDPAVVELSMKNVRMILANGEKLYHGVVRVAVVAVVVVLASRVDENEKIDCIT